MLVSLAITCGVVWTWIPTPWHYFVIAWIAYSVVTTPLTIARMLRSYWNAPQAAAANREVAQRGIALS